MSLDRFRSVDIRIDKADHYFMSSQFAKGGDYNGRTLVVQITNGGLIESQAGVTVNLGWRHESVKNSGLDPFEVVDAAQGIFEISYPREMLNPGRVTAVIQIIDGETITETKNFVIQVEKSPIDETSIVSSNSFTVLQEALIKVNDWNARIDAVEADFIQRANDMEAIYPQQLVSLNSQLAETNQKVESVEENVNIRVDNLIFGSGDANLEVTDAHVSTAKNKTFATLTGRFEEIEKDTSLLMKNRIKNGDFSNGVSEWTSFGATISVADNLLTMVGTGVSGIPNINQNVPIQTAVGKKIYLKAMVRVLNDGVGSIRAVFKDGRTTNFPDPILDPKNGEWYELNCIYKTDIAGTYVGYSNITVQIGYTTAAASLNAVTEIKYVFVSDLTDDFLSGNEPNKYEMLNILNDYDNSWFDGDVNIYSFSELNKKIDNSSKLALKNYVMNGDFSKGINYWSKTTANDISVIDVDGIPTLVLRGSGTSALPLTETPIFMKMSIGDKLYTKCRVRSTHDNVKAIQLRLYNGNKNMYGTRIYEPKKDQWYDISDIYTIPTEATIDPMKFVITNELYVAADGTVSPIELQSLLLTNITETFGGGDEPKNTEMDIVLSDYPNKYFEGTEYVEKPKSYNDFLLSKKTVISDPSQFTSSSQPHVAIDADRGMVYVPYTASRTSYGEANDIIGLSVFPINQPEKAVNYIVIENGVDIGNGQIFTNPHESNILKMSDRVRIFFVPVAYLADRTLDESIFYRDFIFSTKSFTEAYPVTLKTSDLDPGQISNRTNVEAYITSKGFAVTTTAFPIGFISNFADDGLGKTFGMLTSNWMYPVVFETSDYGATILCKGVVPALTNYESQLAIIEGLMYIICREANPNFFTSLDFGETITTENHFKMGNNRPQMIKYKGNIMIIHSEERLAGSISPLAPNGRTNAIFKFGTGGDIAAYKNKLELHSRYGMVYYTVFDYKGELYMTFSDSQLFYDKNTQGKDALYFLRLGEFYPDKDFYVDL